LKGFNINIKNIDPFNINILLIVGFPRAPDQAWDVGVTQGTHVYQWGAQMGPRICFASELDRENRFNRVPSHVTAGFLLTETCNP
jgi:hypothetical protein